MVAESTRSGGFERPSLLALDDDPRVLRAVERDLRRRYGEHCRDLRADPGAAVADLLRSVRLPLNGP